MARARIKIPLVPVHKIQEVIGVLMVLILIGLPLYYFNQLPDIITQYFDASGSQMDLVLSVVYGRFRL